MALKKVYGGAGCGKTYYLNQELVKVLLDTRLYDVSMMTLTRNASREFVERAIAATHTTSTNDIRWFGTMHSIMWKLIGLTRENIVGKKVRDRFNDLSGLKSEPSKLRKATNLDSVRRECMQPCSKDGFTNTLRLTGADTSYKCDVSGHWQHVSFNELVKFGEQWSRFLECEDVFDYTRSIQFALEGFRDSSCAVPFTKLFVDEFQDFSPLQHEVYKELTNLVDDVWICGDDLQVIFRFAGATPSYLLEDVCSEEVILPKTYRYGEAILRNAQKYIDAISVKKERNIRPADHESKLYNLRGNAWIDHVSNDTISTTYLVRAKSSIGQITSVLDAQGVVYGYLGRSSSPVERLVDGYNTIAKLHDGYFIMPEEAQELVKTLPAMCNVSNQQTLFTGAFDSKRKQYLKRGISRVAASEDFLEYHARDGYDSETFAEDFLASGAWDSYEAMRGIKGMTEFIAQKNIIFPSPLIDVITHYVGTIHKFKGNEADNVFLFAQIPYPISDNVRKSVEYRDDELRTFYVGATRARKNLYEISDYLVDWKGNSLMNVADIL